MQRSAEREQSGSGAKTAFSWRVRTERLNESAYVTPTCALRGIRVSEEDREPSTREAVRNVVGLTCVLLRGGGTPMKNSIDVEARKNVFRKLESLWGYSFQE
jgi:hypothetical protein